MRKRLKKKLDQERRLLRTITSVWKCAQHSWYIRPALLRVARRLERRGLIALLEDKARWLHRGCKRGGFAAPVTTEEDR